MRMNWNNLSINLRVILGFGLLVACLLVNSLVTMRYSAEIKQELVDVTDEAVPLVLQTNKISVALLSSDKHLKDMLVTDEPERLQQAADNYTSLRGQFLRELQQLTEAAENYPDIASLLTPLQYLEGSYYTVGEAIYQQRMNILENAEKVKTGKTLFEATVPKMKERVAEIINQHNVYDIRYDAKEVLDTISVLKATTDSALDSNRLTEIDDGIEQNRLLFTSFNKALDIVAAALPALEQEVGFQLRQFIIDTTQDNGLLQRHRTLVVQQRTLHEQADLAEKAVEKAISALEQVNQLAEQEVSRSNDNVLQALSRSQLTSGGLLGVSLLLALLVAFSVSASIRKPLRQLLTVLNAAVEGDMTRKVDYTSGNEFGQLASSTNQLVDQTRHVLSQLAEASASLSNVARGNLLTAESTCKELESQLLETNSVATAMTEMEQTVREVSQSAAVTLQKVLEVEAAANTGRQTMSNNISTTHQLSDKLEQSSQVIGEVETMSKNIGTILDVIRGIAEQTNLLALNAAIEAARAGDQGRGFAVVADEVRNLAQKTANSTDEIQSMIENLQSSTHRAVAVMGECSEQMQSSITQTSDANSAMEEIQGIIAQISDMSTHIASAAEQQQTTTAEIANNITRISEISDSNYQSVESVTETSNALEELAREQDQLVHRFTL